MTELLPEPESSVRLSFFSGRASCFPASALTAIIIFGLAGPLKLEKLLGFDTSEVRL
jgi:hypothetical protein